jgi:hypothetical protein
MCILSRLPRDWLTVEDTEPEGSVSVMVMPLPVAPSTTDSGGANTNTVHTVLALTIATPGGRIAGSRRTLTESNRDLPLSPGQIVPFEVDEPPTGTLAPPQAVIPPALAAATGSRRMQGSSTTGTGRAQTVSASGNSSRRAHVLEVEGV